MRVSGDRMIRFAQNIEEVDGWELYLAGRSWPDDRWDPRITDRLIEIGDSWGLYLAGKYWPDDRYDPRIAQALIDTRSLKWLKHAFTEWEPERTLDLARSWRGTDESEWS